MATETLSEERSGEDALSSIPIVLAVLGALAVLTIMAGFLSILAMLFGGAIGFLIGMGIETVRKKVSHRDDADADDEGEELREEELVL